VFDLGSPPRINPPKYDADRGPLSAYNHLYPSKPHIVSDNVAHTNESEGNTLVL
jgi:hypothetical protein